MDSTSSARKDSGQLGAEEDQQRQEQAVAAEAKGVKAAEEQGKPAPSPAPEVRQDHLVLAGHEHRVGAEADETTDAFDPAAEVVQVDHLAVASNTHELRLKINDTYYSLDAQQGVALNRLVAAGVIALNY